MTKSVLSVVTEAEGKNAVPMDQLRPHIGSSFPYTARYKTSRGSKLRYVIKGEAVDWRGCSQTVRPFEGTLAIARAMPIYGKPDGSHQAISNDAEWRQEMDIPMLHRRCDPGLANPAPVPARLVDHVKKLGSHYPGIVVAVRDLMRRNDLAAAKPS